MWRFRPTRHLPASLVHGLREVRDGQRGNAGCGRLLIYRIGLFLYDLDELDEEENVWFRNEADLYASGDLESA